MPKKSTKTKKNEAVKKASAEELNRDKLGRFQQGNKEGVKFASGIDQPGVETPHLKRQCKYEPRFAEMLIEYFNEPIYDEYKDSFGKIYRVARPVPSKIGFARRIGVWIDTVENWADMKNEDGSPMFPEFATAWKLIERYDKQNIAEASLIGTHNGNFGKFLLSAKYGMKEKTEGENVVTLKLEMPDEAAEESE